MSIPHCASVRSPYCSASAVGAASLSMITSGWEPHPEGPRATLPIGERALLPARVEHGADGAVTFPRQCLLPNPGPAWGPERQSLPSRAPQETVMCTAGSLRGQMYMRPLPEELENTGTAELAFQGPMLGPGAAAGVAKRRALRQPPHSPCTTRVGSGVGNWGARRAGKNQRVPAAGGCLLAAHHACHGMQTSRAFAARCGIMASRCC